MTAPSTLVAVLGTRPEIIKFAPVLAALGELERFNVKTIVTGQQPDLLPAFIEAFGLAPTCELTVMVPGQTVGELLHRTVRALDPVLRSMAPRAVLVQGDTTTALAAALVAAFARIPVVHIEAGLRTGDAGSPYPEEINRTLITHAATLHCAPTPGNARQLQREGIATSDIVLTGNPVVDAITAALPSAKPSPALASLLAATAGQRRVVVTLHRRENFGARMADYLQVIAEFVSRTPSVELVFPVHPNPAVRSAVAELLAGRPRVHLTPPMNYADFLCALRAADLVLSDSGGIQEEVAVVGVPLFILRENTERPEILASGRARLAVDGVQLAGLLSAISEGHEWPAIAPLPHNPFGDGHAGEHIARAIAALLPP